MEKPLAHSSLHLNAMPKKRVKPLISYYGGKQRMASKIVPLLPEHTVYVEPFAGGAAVLFAKPRPQITNNDHYREAINDTHGHLTQMYKFCIDDPKKFCEMIDNTPYSAGVYRMAKKIHEDKNAELKWAAWSTYVLIQQSFGGKYKGGWGTSVVKTNLAANWPLKNPSMACQRLRSVFIEEADAIACLGKWDSPQTLFYCDPPYIGTHCGHYGDYTETDFKHLVEALDACDGSFVLSCYDAKCVSVPDDWERHVFSSYCSASGQGKVGDVKGRRHKACDASSVNSRRRAEVVYRRFNKVPWRPELEKLRQKGVYSCFASQDGAGRGGLWK